MNKSPGNIGNGKNTYLQSVRVKKTFGHSGHEKLEEASSIFASDFGKFWEGFQLG